MDVTVQTKSIDCEDSRWNPHLRSPEWLDVQQFPLMTYRSHHIEFEGSDRAVANGELTLHGVTRPVILSVSQLDCSDSLRCWPSLQVHRSGARQAGSDFGHSCPMGSGPVAMRLSISIDGVPARAPTVSSEVTLLANLVVTSQRVRDTSSRLGKVRELAAFLRTLSPR